MKNQSRIIDHRSLENLTGFLQTIISSKFLSKLVRFENRKSDSPTGKPLKIYDVEL